MPRRGTNIVTRGLNYGKSRRVKSVGTTLGSRQKGSTPPGSTWNEIRPGRSKRRSRMKGGH